MEETYSKFFKGLSTLSLVILGVGSIVFLVFFRKFFLPVFPFLLLFYYFSTLLLHKHILKIARNNVSKFSIKFMALSFFKMFVYIVFGVAYIVFDEENAVQFLIVYLILYMAYAVFEVRSVMRLINESKI